MPLTTQTKVLGINDAKISKITSDTTAAITYATAIDVPGIQKLSVSPTFLTKELRGDEQMVDYYSRVDMINFSFDHAILSLDALAVMLGGAVAATGTTPNQKQTYTLLNSDVTPFFKLEGQTKYTDAGDVHLVLYKCKASKVDYELKGEDYAVVSVSGVAIPTNKDGKIKDFVINETATAIS